MEEMACRYCDRFGPEALFRRSSIDCMESPRIIAPLHIPGQRKVIHSINNPMICEQCKLGLDAFARACREVISEKGTTT